ncbi:type IV pilin protein [Halomonas halocynthiae]|uniref:type IV pilin protein n=1 Tax=Halomonas halocynthiae TaxID=176290 RepID=UPI000421CF49|nr:type IV pilin protein [Halomonas halocynthiae]
MRATGQQGFTLIELMIVVVLMIVAVSVAVPSYQTYLERGRRSEAVTTLMNLAQAQERFMVIHGYYAPSLSGSLASGDGLGWSGEDAVFYQVALSRPTDVAYTLSAKPQGSQVADTVCASFTLTHTGQKNVTGTGGVVGCW